VPIGAARLVTKEIIANRKNIATIAIRRPLPAAGFELVIVRFLGIGLLDKKFVTC
jgi:hypothetical protein